MQMTPKYTGKFNQMMINHEVLQRDLETLKTWSDRWLLKFHPSKCYCINIGKKNDDVITFKYSMTEDGNKFDMTGSVLVLVDTQQSSQRSITLRSICRQQISPKIL